MSLEDKQVKLKRSESGKELQALYVEDVKEALANTKERIFGIWDDTSVAGRELKKVLDEEFGYKQEDDKNEPRKKI